MNIFDIQFNYISRVQSPLDTQLKYDAETDTYLTQRLAVSAIGAREREREQDRRSGRLHGRDMGGGGQMGPRSAIMVDAGHIHTAATSASLQIPGMVGAGGGRGGGALGWGMGAGKGREQGGDGGLADIDLRRIEAVIVDEMPALATAVVIAPWFLIGLKRTHSIAREHIL